ncbi:MAG: hypothetical protein ACHQT9_02350, partial [Candidatus Saccharimonadales bacterium]
MLKKILQNSDQTKNLKKFIPLFTFLIIIVGVGTYFLISSHAANPYSLVNADKGVLGCGASTSADSTTNDGSKVTFGTCGGGGSGCTFTATTVAQAVSDVSNAKAGNTICMSPGTYGSITLTG